MKPFRPGADKRLCVRFAVAPRRGVFKLPSHWATPQSRPCVWAELHHCVTPRAVSVPASAWTLRTKQMHYCFSGAAVVVVMKPCRWSRIGRCYTSPPMPWLLICCYYSHCSVYFIKQSRSSVDMVSVAKRNIWLVASPIFGMWLLRARRSAVCACVHGSSIQRHATLWWGSNTACHRATPQMAVCVASPLNNGNLWEATSLPRHSVTLWRHGAARLLPALPI